MNFLGLDADTFHCFHVSEVAVCFDHFVTSNLIIFECLRVLVLVLTLLSQLKSMK